MDGFDLNTTLTLEASDVFAPKKVFDIGEIFELVKNSSISFACRLCME